MPFDNGTFSKLYDWLGNKTDIPRKRGDSLNQEFENFSDGLTDLKSEIDTLATSDLTDWPASVSTTEIGYLDGVTSAIQTQLNGKAALSHSHAATDITSGTLADARLPARLGNRAKVITDWNDATETGWYIGNNAANVAINNGWNFGFVSSYSDTYLTQEIHAFTADSPSNTLTFRRECNAGTWGAWYRLRKSEAELDARYAQLSGATFTGNLKVLATTAEMRVESTDDNKGIWLDSGSDAYYAARIITDRVEQRLFVNGTAEAYRVSFQQHLWRINAAEGMRLTSSGNLGINYSTPPERLTVGGNISATGTIAAKLPSYTVATAPSASASGAGFQIYVTDETGGAVPAFSDGTDWRRVTDRSVIA